MPIKKINTQEFRFSRKETYSHEDVLDIIGKVGEFAFNQVKADTKDDFTQLKNLQTEKATSEHQAIVNKTLSDFNIVDGKEDGVLRLADIKLEDDEQAIKTKLNKVKEDYKEFFTEKGSNAEEVNKNIDPAIENRQVEVYL